MNDTTIHCESGVLQSEQFGFELRSLTAAYAIEVLALAIGVKAFTGSVVSLNSADQDKAARTARPIQ